VWDLDFGAKAVTSSAGTGLGGLKSPPSASGGSGSGSGSHLPATGLNARLAWLGVLPLLAGALFLRRRRA
jgi:hypothetical protein